MSSATNPEQSTQNADSAQERTGFVGRVQEQRQFLVALQGLLTHHRRWATLAQEHGADFDLTHAPGDDSYANIFLLHGIGGIGKSWLTRRCLTLANGIPSRPSVLSLYDDVSLGPPVLEPAHLLERLADKLTEAGYPEAVAPYRQAVQETPRVVEMVTRYQFEQREQWNRMVKTAAELVARRLPEPGYQSFDETSLAYTHASGAEAAGSDAPTLAKAYDLLLEQMAQRGRIQPDQAALFRNPPAAQAARLAVALKQIALRRPLVIGLDNLEIIVPLEPLIRDCLVLPTNHSPLIWILSGRYHLADERMVELNGVKQFYKGYRDLLGENPPVVWDMSIFGDADLRDYLEAEAERRHTHLLIDDDLIEAIKVTSSGVPLVVEMVTDALFAMDRDEFLRDFALDDRSLLPDDRLEKIAERFLRYCLTQPQDLERVQAMALLRKGIDAEALTAAWRLPAGHTVAESIQALRTRYAFVLPEGLHDAVYEFLRRQLRTDPTAAETRRKLGLRAVEFFQAQWEQLQQQLTDSTRRVRHPRWQRATRDLLNALLWYNPDRAVLFLLPRFVEGLGFDRAFSNGLLLQAEEFLHDSAALFSDSYANLLHRMRVGLQNIDWAFDEPGEAIGVMLNSLLDAPGLAPLHLSILYLWQGNWQVENGHFAEGLAAYRQADEYLPAEAADLRRQLGKAYYEVSSRLLWPERSNQAVASEPGLQAARRATELDDDNGGAWYNLGIALDYLDRPDEALPAYERAATLEPRPDYFNSLGEIYDALGRDEDAVTIYRQAIDLDPAYAWPYHNLALIYAGRGEYETALELYQQAIEHHQHDKERAVTWDNFGDAHAALGNDDEAISAYRWAGVLHPRLASPWFGLGNIYLRQGRHPEAIDAYQKTVALDADHAWAHHQLGLVYANQGDVAAAEPYYRQAIDLHDDDGARAITWHNLGDVYSLLERSPEAIEAYRQAIKLNPRQADSWYSLGDVYISNDNQESAVNAYRRAVEIEPDFAAAWNSLGNIYTAQERFGDAVDAYRRVIDLEPEYAWPYNNLGYIYSRREDYVQARDFYEQAISRHDDDRDKAVSWSNLGDVQVALDNNEAAITAYRAAADLDPDYAWPRHHLARLYEQRGDDDQAIALYRQAIERHTEPADRLRSWRNLAGVYQRLGRHSEAVSAYRQVIALEPEDAYVWNALGDSYRAQAQNAQAGEAYRQAVELAPDFAPPYDSLGQLATQSGNNADAVTLYRQAIEREQDEAVRAASWSRLGDAYQALAQDDDAAPAYRQASRLAPRQPHPYYCLGAIAERRGDLAAAGPLYQQAIERYAVGVNRPEQARAWNGLGNTQQARQQLTEAIASYRRATELDERLAAPWRNLGDVYYELGQHPPAVESYSQAIELAPEPPQPYHQLGLIFEAEGDFEAAVARLRQALARYPDEATKEAKLPRANVWNHLGNACHGLGKTTLALEAYRRAVQLDETYFEPQVSLGGLYSDLAQYDDAIAAYRRAVELSPDVAEPWRRLGDVYLTQTRYDEAGEAYQQAILLHPAAPEPYYSMGHINERLAQPTQAIGYYEQALDRFAAEQTDERAQTWNGLGNIYRSQGRLETAARAYRQAIELAPYFAPPHHRLADIYLQSGRPESALVYYRQALTRFSVAATATVRAEAHTGQGDAYTALQRWDEAAAAYQQAIDMDDAFAEPWFKLGNVYRATGQPAEAQPAYEKALDLEPTYAWASNNLGLVQLEQGHPAEAQKLFKQALAHHTDDAARAVAWNNIGDVHQRQRRYAEAEAAYRQAIELDASFARPWKSLADVQRAQGRSEGVVDGYRQAITLEPGYAWPYHSLGLIYKQQGAYGQAIEYYRQAIERHQTNPDRAVSWNGLGNVYLAMGQYEPAVEAYRQAIRHDDRDAWPYHNLAFVYKQQGRNQQAIGLYRQAIERFEGSRHQAVSWNNLGNVYNTLGRNQEAIEAYRTAIDLNPDYALPWNSLGETHFKAGRTEAAVEAYRAALQRQGDYVLAWNNLGDANWQLKKYDQAVAAYERAISLDERYAWPYHNLGLLYDERGDYESAIRYYQQAIERHAAAEQKAVLAEKMADLYRITGETERAIEAYRQAAAHDPAYASPWYNLGNIFAAQEQYDEAVNAYRRAISLKPAEPWPYHNLALVYEQQEIYSEAIAYYRQAIERHRSDAERAISWDNLGSVYQDLGRWEEAAEAFRESIQLNADYALPWNSLGEVYHALGDHEQAIDAFERAIGLDASYVWAYNNLGTVYESLAEPEQAIGIYLRATDQPGQSQALAASWNSLGDLYHSLGQEDEAIAAYEKAIELDPYRTWAYNRLAAIYERRGDSDRAFALYRQATQRHRQRAG